MTAEIVRDMSDVEKFYYYRNGDTPIPDEFPCIMIEEDVDYGIAGSAYRYTFHYVPNHFKNWAEVYMEGFINGTKSI